MDKNTILLKQIKVYEAYLEAVIKEIAGMSEKQYERTARDIELLTNDKDINVDKLCSLFNKIKELRESGKLFVYKGQYNTISQKE